MLSSVLPHLRCYRVRKVNAEPQYADNIRSNCKLPCTEYVHCMSIFHFILTKTLQGSCYCPHFTNDKPKAPTSVIICLSHKRTTPGRTKTLTQHSLTTGHPVTALRCLDGWVWGMCILYSKCQCSTKLGARKHRSDEALSCISCTIISSKISCLNLVNDITIFMDPQLSHL